MRVNLNLKADEQIDVHQAPEKRSKREELGEEFGYSSQNGSVNGSSGNGGGVSRLEQVENRLGAIEQMLVRMEQALGDIRSQQQRQQYQSTIHHSSPITSTFPSLQHLSSSSNGFGPSPSSISLSPISTTVPIQTSKLSAALNSHPPQQVLPLDGNNSSIYKTGGFLINTEETALTFWGSTSALGGTTNNAHLYKAIPRFINGILMVHIPARTHQEEARESAKNTPSGSLSGSVGSAGANSLDLEIQEKWNERREKVGSIHSLVVLTVELQELIPLPDDVVDLILKNFWEQFH
ncbi:UNVERIFIED_CONTAM: hypothetical protein HDU68_009508, partial [Siphonaria sp. JEL0065]